MDNIKKKKKKKKLYYDVNRYFLIKKY
jgi:hypothetical protein